MKNGSLWLLINFHAVFFLVTCVDTRCFVHRIYQYLSSWGIEDYYYSSFLETFFFRVSFSFLIEGNVARAGGGVLPFVSYIDKCSPNEYAGFSAVLANLKLHDISNILIINFFRISTSHMVLSVSLCFYSSLYIL